MTSVNFRALKVKLAGLWKIFIIMDGIPV